MNEHENDPQFQYYNSDAESEGSHNSHEFYGNGDVGVVSPTSPGWNKDIGNKNFGISGKNLTQSNLQKHKSLSTPLFDLTKLDTIETAVDVDDDDDDDDTYALQNEAYDSDNDEDQPGRSRCILVFVEVKGHNCYTSELKYIFQFKVNTSCVMGQNSSTPEGEQNSLTPQGNNKLNF